MSRWKSRLRRLGSWLWLWLHGTVVLMVLAAIVATVQTPATEEDPAGVAGIYAPLIAFCAAIMLLFDYWKLGDGRYRLARRIFIAVATAVSTLLWLADSVETHPTNAKLWGDLGVVWAFGGVIAAFLMLIGALVLWQPHNDREVGDD